jgi:hypothetical protein
MHYYYLIRDSFGRRDSYLTDHSEWALSPATAKRFTNKREATSTLKAWAKEFDYANPDAWLSVVRVFAPNWNKPNGGNKNNAEQVNSRS